MSKSAAIATYRRFPRELFRVNSGWRVKLRPFKTNNPEAFYDIATAHEEGKRLREMKVLPKALEPDYKCELLWLALRTLRTRGDMCEG